MDQQALHQRMELVEQQALRQRIHLGWSKHQKRMEEQARVHQTQELLELRPALSDLHDPHSYGTRGDHGQDQVQLKCL